MKLRNIFTAFVVLLVSLITLASCSAKTVYDLYKKEGAYLDKDNIYTLVSAEDFKQVIASNDKMVYLFYGSASNVESKEAIITINNQAKQFGITEVYYINADEHNISAEARSSLKSLININDASKVPTLIAYGIEVDEETKNKVLFDISKDSDAKYFKEDGKIDYTALSGFMFRDQCDRNELPKL